MQRPVTFVALVGTLAALAAGYLALSAEVATSQTVTPVIAGANFPNATQAPRLAHPNQPAVPAVLYSFTQCQSGAGPLCMWQYANYSGVFWFRNTNTNNINQWYYVGNSYQNNQLFNDRASSLYCNRGGCGVSKDWYPSNDAYCIANQGVLSNLAAYVWEDGTTMNNSISSFNLQSRCG